MSGWARGFGKEPDEQLFNLRLPMGESGQMLPAGQGYYARRGRYRKVKVATCHAGAVTLAAWVEKIINRKP